MKLHRDHDACLVRLDRGETVPDALLQLAAEQGWQSGYLSGIGGVDDVVLAYYDLTQKRYLEFAVEGIVELLALTGNLSLVDDKPFWHLHAVVGDRNGRVRGGHLVRLRVAVTLECWIRPGSRTVARKPDADTGLNLLNL